MTKTEHDPLPPYQKPVGELLGDEIEYRGWSQADFAAVIDRPTQFVSEIVTGKKEITRESAAQIAAALGNSPEYWLKLQDQYHLAEQARNATTQNKLGEVRRRAVLSSKAPIGLLQKRGFLTGTSLDELESEVIDLFELPTLDSEPGFAAAAKRANQGSDISILQRAWVACVRKAARSLPPQARYSPEALRKLVDGLSQGLKTAADFAELPNRFAVVGVRLVYVEMLPGGKIDGCAMFVDGYPVIGLSGRGKRLDKVLFTLLHEAAHVLLEHVDADHLIAEDFDERDIETAQETEANARASTWVFPKGFPVVPERISGPWVQSAAAELGIAPIVLVGQLQHRRHLDWRTTLAKNAPSVDATLAGWK